MIELTEPYQPRPIRYLECWKEDGWRLKVYGIAYQRHQPRSQLIAVAKTVARQRLPKPAIAPGRYGVGFLGIHDGRTANFVFLDWWSSENELNHHVFVSQKDKAETLEEITSSGLIACVWDLSVLCFERQAWINKVLANPDGVDLDGYLACQLNEDI